MIFTQVKSLFSATNKHHGLISHNESAKDDRWLSFVVSFIHVLATAF